MGEIREESEGCSLQVERLEGLDTRYRQDAPSIGHRRGPGGYGSCFDTSRLRRW